MSTDRELVESTIDKVLCQHCYRVHPCTCSLMFAAEIRRIGAVRQEQLNSYPERRRDFGRRAYQARRQAA